MTRRVIGFVLALSAAMLFGTAVMPAADQHDHEHGDHQHGPAGRVHKPGQRKAEVPRPILSTHELMELFNEPLYHELKELVEAEPSDRKGWTRIRDEGLRAAEIVNLVAIRELSEGQEQQWQQLTQEAQSAALDLASAAKRQDWKSTTAAYRSLIKNCNDCHQAIAPDHAPELEP